MPSLPDLSGRQVVTHTRHYRWSSYRTNTEGRVRRAS